MNVYMIATRPIELRFGVLNRRLSSCLPSTFSGFGFLDGNTSVLLFGSSRYTGRSWSSDRCLLIVGLKLSDENGSTGSGSTGHGIRFR